MLKKIGFYINKLKKDFFDPLKYDITEDVSSDKLREYYFIFREEELLAGGSQDFHFDEAGIPVIPTYIDLEEDRFHYFPISIGQYGLAIYHTYLKTRSAEDRDRFLNIVRWFSEEQDDKGTWKAEVPVPKFNLETGWISAMAQSRGISILLRGYQLTGNQDFLEKAELALDVFELDVEDGGIRSHFQDYLFFEEYPSLPRSPHVLNGMIFSLFGLYDFARLGNSRSKELFEKGIKSIENTLDLFDIGFWSKYDLSDLEYSERSVNAVTAHYHNIHIKQLQVLFNITRSDIIKCYLDKWKHYEKSKFNLLKAYTLKFNFLRKILKRGS